MKTTAVVESLSYYKTNVLFQRIPAYFKHLCCLCMCVILHCFSCSVTNCVWVEWVSSYVQFVVLIPVIIHLVSPLLLFNWFPKYCSTVISVCLMCLVFLVITHPVFMLGILYYLQFLSSLPCSINVPYVQGLPSSLWTATVDLVWREIGTLSVSLF